MFSYSCSQGHLVVGSDVRRCSVCDAPGPGPAPWEADPYVLYHLDIAYEQGLLQGERRSAIQRSLLTMILIRRSKTKQQEAIEHFEQQMMLLRPELWEQYRANQRMQEELDDVDVVWRLPQSPEEAAQVAAELQRAFGGKPQPMVPEVNGHSSFEDESLGAWLTSPDLSQMGD